MHKHHIIPRHAGGTDDPSNLIELTVEEHAEEHRKLFEQYGRWQDEVAWKALSGQINSDEIRREKAKHFQNEMIENGTHKYLNSEYQSKLGKISQEKRKQSGTFAYDINWQKENSPFYNSEWQRALTVRRTLDGKNPLSKHNQKLLTCVGCGKTMNKGNFYKWKHGESCERK